MFDKISIVNDKIKIIRYVIEWQEKVSTGLADSRTKEEIFKTISEISYALNEAERNSILESLEKQGIDGVVAIVNVPKSIMKYDGEEWTKGRDEAILYINEVGKYHPYQLEIDDILAKLKEMDYMNSKKVDGEYTSEEWEVISNERISLRKRMRELKTKLL